MKYAIPLISLIAVSSTIYAFNIETDPEKIIEKENRQKVLECLENVQSGTGTAYIIQKQIERCSKIKLRSITGTASGAIVPPPEHTGEEIASELHDLYEKVCQKQINSPLCKDRQLFYRLYYITEERLPGKNFYPILLGITNAESSLGLNYAKDKVGGTCSGRNNFGGIKWKKSDSGESIRDQKIPDEYGCYLYHFESIEEYWISKVNTVRFGYKGCVDSPTPIKCMSYAYVGDRNIAEPSWIRNVSIFLD